MGAIETFATEAVARGHRLQFWNELADRCFVGTRIGAADPDFSGRLAHWRVGELALTRVGSTASRIDRVAPASSEGNVVLHLQLRGGVSHQQQGREAALRPGDYVLSCCETPYRIEGPAHELLIVELPRAEISERVGSVEERIGRLGDGSVPGAHLLRSYLLSLWALSDLSIADEDWEAGASRSFYDLLAMALRGDAPARPRSGSSRRRERILCVVEARLTEAQLSIREIAAECDVSVRTLQAVFAEMGTTPSAYLLARRLQRSADRLIADPAISITEVAFDHGFSDSGHFSRCFHRRFGAPPRVWRRRGGV
jgi:AraC-like DNA-binding protein